MTLSLEALPNPDSPLSRLDGRWRLLALAATVAALATLQTLPASSAALGYVLLLALLARIPARWLLGRWGAMSPFLLLCILLVPLCVPEAEPLAQWGPLALSRRGLVVAGLICLKALAIVTVVLVGLTTAPLHTTLHAAHRLHVPGMLIQLALLSYRYIFLVTDELARLRVALRVRGYRSRPSRHSYRTIAHVSGTLLVRSHERAERVSQAMRCRGFDGQFRSLAEFHTRPADILAFGLMVVVAAALLTWDFCLRV